ncbi:MAG: hypothetical protein LBC64_03835 [Fibromonadaceae bacterium]|jgi:uncharacterized protein YoxC|nr:hypothetical protein [Fibromonadaceae bacterium]
MKKISILLSLTFSLCSANQPKNADMDSLIQTIQATLDSTSRKNDSIKKVNDSIIAVNNSLHKTISDNITIETLIKSQEFYNNAFNSLLFKVSIILCIIGILVAIIGIFLGIVKSNKEKEFEKLNKDFTDINGKILCLEKKLKEQIESQKNDFSYMKNKLEEDGNEYQKKFDIMFRFISKRHFDLALRGLKKDDFWEYFSNMYLFCFCLTGINLNYHDSSNLHIAYRAFEEKCKDNNVISGDEPVFYRFVEYLLKLIKHCVNTKQNDYSTSIKSVYNKILTKFSYDQIKEGLNQEIKESNYDSKDIQEILILAERYKD